jgi:uncharacterized protein with HEPN domain
MYSRLAVCTKIADRHCRLILVGQTIGTIKKKQCSKYGQEEWREMMQLENADDPLRQGC